MSTSQKTKHKSRIRQRKTRRQLGSRMYKNYTEDMLQLACELVESGKMTSRDAERQIGIPRRTIDNKIKNRHSKSVGHPTALSAAEENKLVKVLQASSDFGAPLTKIDVKLVVYEYLKNNSRDHVFMKGIPGDAWVQGFLARNAEELSVRTTQNISKARAEKGSEEITEYFENLSTTIKDIPAKNILNFDETNLSDDPGSAKGIFRRGVKYPERVVNSTKGNISLMFTATASGETLPLYVVYKATEMFSGWVTGGPPQTRYNRTKSGWFDSATFEDYFETIIIPWAEKTEGPKVVICDNLTSHINIKVVELCEQNDIKFVFIPPRSTHLTQPLDVAYFAPLKKEWRKILYQYKLRNPKQTTLNKNHFPKLLGALIEAMELRDENIVKSGFRASGVFPFNPREVLKKIPEMQEEVMSYGIDQTLMDYLKKTRSPNPMAVKRNKKVNCEPGKSVTISDLNVNTFKSKATKKSSEVAKMRKAKEGNKTEESLLLNDEPGFLANADLIPNMDIDDQEFFMNLEGSLAISMYQDITNPESLSKHCITVINSCLGQSENGKNTSSTCEILVTGCPVKEKKINILSNVIIKAATSHGLSANRKVMSKTSTTNPIRSCPAKEKKTKMLSNLTIKTETSKSENTVFASTSKSDLPECLQVKKIKRLQKVKKEYKGQRQKKTRNVKIANKGKTPVPGRRPVNKRSKMSDTDSNSTFADDTIITVDTDESDYETMNDCIAESLREQNEKENLEPDSFSVPFGLHEIKYFEEIEQMIENDDWIIAKFATKRSLKHFVGNVVHSQIPTVKFVRKVKDSKCEKGTTFTYPIVDDICNIQHLEDVVTILPKPKITRRGRIIFDVDFSNFNIQ